MGILDRKYRWTIVAIIVSTLGNPLFLALFFPVTTGGMLPDSALYLTFAKSLFSEGALHVDGWAHVDSGFVLSPFYPTLIATFGRFIDDPLFASQIINAVILIIASPTLYAFTKRHASPIAAICCLIVFQWNAKTFFYGTSTLTEGVFIALTIFLIEIADRYIDKPSTKRVTTAGLICVALVLTRQIGVFAPAVFAVVLGSLFATRPSERKMLLKQAMVFATIFSLPVLLYSALVYTQTGHTPLTQVYRLDKYVVMSERAKEMVDGDYATIHAKRREDRRLNEDASEMVAALVAEVPQKPDWQALPVRYLQNISDNLQLAAGTLGFGLTCLFLISCVYSIAVLARKKSNAGIVLIPFSALAYFIILCFVSSKIGRYLDVLQPLIIAQIVIAIHQAFEHLRISKPSRQLAWSGILVILMTLTPRLVIGEKFLPMTGEADNPLAHCRTWVTQGEPIFSLSTLEPYLLGGIFRALPNDSLEKIAIYAQRTGVRWMVIRTQGAGLTELQLYGNASWLSSSIPVYIQNNRFEPICRDADNVATLYAIR